MELPQNLRPARTCSLYKNIQTQSFVSGSTLAGNVWEWVTDWADDVRKTIKGGSYKRDKDFAVCSSSEGYNPNSGRPSSVGFRCARSLN
jgi:formylglycine-generating enzyme required for sulfatase activity